MNYFDSKINKQNHEKETAVFIFAHFMPFAGVSSK
jgi:hypothetical protein